MFSMYLDSLLIELRPFLKDLLAFVILAFPFLFGLSVLFNFFAWVYRKFKQKWRDDS